MGDGRWAVAGRLAVPWASVTAENDQQTVRICTCETHHRLPLSAVAR